MPIFKIADNSTAVIYDENTGQTIAKTRVRNYDSLNNSITVDGKYFSTAENQKVSLLIIDGSNIIECMGNVRKQGVGGNREISLYRTKVKEDRGAIRYFIKAPAVIENMIVDGKMVPLSPPLEVLVENISTGGVMLMVKGNALRIRASFQLKLMVDGSELLINTCVVHVIQEDKEGKRLGCSFVSLSE